MFDRKNYLSELARLSELQSSSDIIYYNTRVKKPYTITVKGYKYLYFNSTPIGELSPEEQVILMESTDEDVTKIPANTVAAIYRARQILKKSKDSEEAKKISKKYSTQTNKAYIEEESKSALLSQKARKLEYYLQVEKEMAAYRKNQTSFFYPIKNKLHHFFNKNVSLSQPYSNEEIEIGKQFWKNFREEQNFPEDISDEECLERYKYGYPKKCYYEFEYLKNIDLLNFLYNEYKIYVKVEQIISGKAYELAKKSFTKKNTFPYLKYNKTNPSESIKNIDEKNR